MLKKSKELVTVLFMVEKFYDSSVLVTDEELAKVDSIEDLAPLHNPANIKGVRSFQKRINRSSKRINI